MKRDLPKPNRQTARDEGQTTDKRLISVTIKISESLLNAYRKEALKHHVTHQTLMRIKLHEGLGVKLVGRAR